MLVNGILCCFNSNQYSIKAGQIICFWMEHNYMMPWLYPSSDVRGNSIPCGVLQAEQVRDARLSRLSAYNQRLLHINHAWSSAVSKLIPCSIYILGSCSTRSLKGMQQPNSYIKTQINFYKEKKIFQTCFKTIPCKKVFLSSFQCLPWQYYPTFYHLYYSLHHHQYRIILHSDYMMEHPLTFSSLKMLKESTCVVWFAFVYGAGATW